MPVGIGDLTPSAFAIGDVTVNRLCIGDTQVYPVASLFAFDATGPGSAVGTMVSTSTTNWNHSAAAGADVFVEIMWATTSSKSATRTVTYGGVAMTSLGSSITATGNLNGELFHLAGAPSGVKSIVVTVTSASTIFSGLAGVSISYTGVSSVAVYTPAIGTPNTSMTMNTVSSSGKTVVQGFVSTGAITSGSYNQTLRVQASGSTAMALFGEAPGSSLVMFSASKPVATVWLGMAVELG